MACKQGNYDRNHFSSSGRKYANNWRVSDHYWIIENIRVFKQVGDHLNMFSNEEEVREEGG